MTPFPAASPPPDPACARPRGSGRARPLPPDERRAALIAATRTLVLEHGTKVSTRMIAEAAGVAEGTIFRVFPDKEALVRAAVETALDPAPTLAELAAIDVTLPLEERLVRLTEVLQRRLVAVFSLLTAVGMHGPPRGRDEHLVAGRQAMIFREMVRLLEPDRDRFRLPTEEVARLLRLLTFSGSPSSISDGRLLTAEQIAAVLLDGVRQHQPGDHHCPEHPHHPKPTEET